MLGPNQIGPERPITGRGPVIGAIPKEWAGHVAQNRSLGTIPKTAPISELLRRFLKTKSHGFSNVR